MSELRWRDRKRTLFGLPLSFTVYELYDEKLTIKKGIFTIREDEVRLYRIMDVSTKRNLYQRIFGIGTIHCCSADKSMGEFDIQSVKKPREIKEMLSDMIEVVREEKRVVTREFMGDSDGDEHLL